MESYTDDQVIMGEHTPSQTHEEAIPLVIFNEEKRCKYSLVITR